MRDRAIEYLSVDFGDREYGKGGVIRRAGGTVYETDADGFLVKKTLSDGAVWHYAWDAHGQLTEVTRPDKKKVAYAYDAFGRRVSKTFDGATTAFIWDGDDLVHERVQGQDGAFLPLTTWVFEPGSFTPLAKIEGRKRYGIVGDHLGAPTMLATEAGELAWQAQLDIYGVPREDVSGIKEEHKTDNPWRYPGQYEDKETGLYYNRFRYYDPELGRYISEDPIGLEGGLPQYGYVHDLVGWVDPFGLSGVLVIGEGQAAVDATALELSAAGYPAESMMFPRNQWRGRDPALDSAVDWNRKWIRQKNSEGYKIVDIGIDSGRAKRSAFYAAELEEVAKAGKAKFWLKKLPSGETIDDLRKSIGCGG